MTQQSSVLPTKKLKEIIFVVEEDIQGGYIAQALGESIFTEADDLGSLKQMITDAINCHFPQPEMRPRLVRLHIVHDEVFAL